MFRLLYLSFVSFILVIVLHGNNYFPPCLIQNEILYAIILKYLYKGRLYDIILQTSTMHFSVTNFAHIRLAVLLFGLIRMKFEFSVYNKIFQQQKICCLLCVFFFCFLVTLKQKICVN